MNIFKFVSIKDVNTFSAWLKKGMNITIECVGKNDPFLIYEDRVKIANTISENYKTYCDPNVVSQYFRKERKFTLETKLIVNPDDSSSENYEFVTT